MIIGQTIACHDDSTGEYYYTPWFPRQGRTVVSSFEVVSIGPTTQITVSLQTKNGDDADDPSTATTIGSASSTSAGDVKSFESSSSCEELVRYQVHLVRTSGSATSGCHFRILKPSWVATGAQGV